MADDAALVLVGPDDTVETVIAKVRGAGARSVQLLVAEGAPALQGIGGLVRLRDSASEAAIDLLLITSDQKTLSAARVSKVEVVGVQGAQVLGLPAAGNGSKMGDAAAAPAAAAIAPATPADEPYASDDEFLRALDELAGATFARGAAPPVDRQDDAFFAASDTLDEPTPTRPRRRRATDPLPPVVPVGPDDYDYGDAPTEQIGRAAYTPDAVERRSTRRTPRRLGRAAAQPRPRREFDAEPEPVGRRGVNPLVRVIPVVLVLLLLALGGVLFFGNRAEIVVAMPQISSEDQPFSERVLPISAAAPADANSPAVQAVPVSAEASANASGTVAGETQVPNNPARGTVTLLNYTNGTLDLPQGTEFIGANGQGQEVRFTSDAPVAIGPQTSSRQGVQIVLSPGQAAVALTARSPGSASNVDANAINQLAIPGQPPVALQGNLSIEHGPLTGGDERTVRVVTDNDVEQQLAAALTSLDEEGQRELQAQAANAGSDWQLEISTIAPTRDQLMLRGAEQVYEMTVSPEVGQEVDPANPAFTVSVRATFSALATPPNSSLSTQLATALPRQLAIEGLLTTGLAPTITGWQWDGSRLLVDGILRPDGSTPRLDAPTRAAILDAVRGKPYAEAKAAMDSFVQQGIIGSYTLPERDAMPSLNFQLDLKVEQ